MLYEVITVINSTTATHSDYLEPAQQKAWLQKQGAAASVAALDAFDDPSDDHQQGEHDRRCGDRRLQRAVSEPAGDDAGHDGFEQELRHSFDAGDSYNFV